jgi:hypothetical protein
MTRSTLNGQPQTPPRHKSPESRMPGKLARPVRRGAVRKRTRELREPRRTAYPTIHALADRRIFMCARHPLVRVASGGDLTCRSRPQPSPAGCRCGRCAARFPRSGEEQLTQRDRILPPAQHSAGRVVEVQRREPGRARTRLTTIRSAPPARAETTTSWQRSRIGGHSRSMIRSSAWSIAVLRADVTVSLWCPVTAMRRSRKMLPSSVAGALSRGAWLVASVTFSPDACEVSGALSRGELASDALLGNLRDHRR